MDTQKLKDFVSLEKQKKDLEAELKRISAELKDLEQQAIQELVSGGTDAWEGDGRVLAIKEQAFASGATEEVAQAFVDAGMEELAPRYCHPSRLHSYVQEVYAEVKTLAEKEDRLPTVEDLRAALPEPLRAVLHLYLGHKLSSRISYRKT